ncbi:cell division protein FtsZ [Natrialbaceae archaeon GCM10025810]|uniref:cell division protein FtsZ n=1 Tax=Halovalidus salilacus TaxID=3075124 RepID=UPI00360BEFE3
MQFEVIGVGGAGCRIASAIRAAEPADYPFVGDAFAFDTDTEDLAANAEIPETHRHRYGHTTDDGLEGDVERGFEFGREHADELSRALDEGRPAASDGFLVAVGLGGATGGGTVPELVRQLRREYDKPVYVLATLPADREFVRTDADPASTGVKRSDDGPPRPYAAANAIATLEALDGLANAVVVFDNEEWIRRGESLEEARDRLNREFATRVVAAFAACSDATADAAAATSVVDGNDLRRVFGDTSDVATIGYGEQEVETGGGSRFGLGLFGKKSEPDVEASAAIRAVETTINKALRGKLTLECDRDSAERGLLVVGGPPAWLDRRAVADGQRALQSTIDSQTAVGGDAPRPDGDAVFAAVVLAGIEANRRSDELREWVQNNWKSADR